MEQLFPELNRMRQLGDRTPPQPKRLIFLVAVLISPLLSSFCILSSRPFQSLSLFLPPFRSSVLPFCLESTVFLYSFTMADEVCHSSSLLSFFLLIPPVSVKPRSLSLLSAALGTGRLPGQGSRYIRRQVEWNVNIFESCSMTLPPASSRRTPVRPRPFPCSAPL